MSKLGLAHLSTKDHDPPPDDEDEPLEDQENLEPFEDSHKITPDDDSFLCSWNPTPKLKNFQDPSTASGKLVSPICLEKEDNFFSDLLMADVGFLGNSGDEL